MIKNTKFSHRDTARQIKCFVYSISNGNIYLATNRLKRDFMGAKVMFTSGALSESVYTILDTVHGAAYTSNNKPLTLITLDNIDSSNLKIGDKLYVYWDLLSLSPDEFSNMKLVQFSNYKEGAERVQGLPAGVVNVVFEDCNIDNMIIPEGCSISRTTTNKKLEAQNDNEDWDMDKLKPLRESEYIELGLSTDFNDLPDSPIVGSIVENKIKLLAQEEVL